LRHDQFRDPTREVQHLHHRSDLASHLIGHRVIGLVDDEDVGNLHDAGFEHLHRIAAARLESDERRLRQLRDLDLALPHPDRLDQHDVYTEGIHEQHSIGRRSGHAAQVPAAGHRPNKHVGIDEVLG